ncbi:MULTISPECIES: hypothetical protein [Sphingopyxis]|uniref:hypothetical protein n=1 Tax=Sphingopyxis TaxID=165697 RepID=UPI0010F7E26B|nr:MULTISPECIES: hypothetical protein [Sphingopyxis]
MRLSVVLAVLLVPTAAQAQFVPRTPPPSDRMPGISDMGTAAQRSTVDHDLRETRARIRDGRDAGQLSKREARALRREAGQISTLADRYGRDGLSDSERRELEMRAQVLRDLTAAQRLRPKAP